MSIIWNKLVPLKVSSFSWRMMQDRIHMLINLLKRQTFNPHFSKECHLCSVSNEDFDRLFFNCGKAKVVWNKAHRWFGINSMTEGVRLVHYVNHNNLADQNRRDVWSLIWHCSVWHIWSSRNSKLFKGVNFDEHEIVVKIQFLLCFVFFFFFFLVKGR